jgi:PAS domain S-box-containing protein
MSDKILLVEDEKIGALDIKNALESFGYLVPYVASNGEEAIEKAIEIMPDLIIMDIILKGEKNGIDVASEIKNLNIPFIYLTAHSEESTVQRAIATEPYAYFIKPFNTTELKLAVQMALYKKNMQLELEESEKSYRDLVDNSMVPIYKTNLNGDILFANEAAMQLFGFESVEEFKTINISQLYKNLEERKRIIEKLMKEGKFSNVDVEMISNTGETINILLSAHLDRNIISGMMIDISQLKSSLKEKEVLIKEIHHRVKNNMQIVSSMLNLQAHHVKDDEMACDVLMESRNRVRSMAMVHEKLYQSKDLTHINFEDYIRRLVLDLFSSYGISQDQIKLIINVKDIMLNIETAVPCGLIITELVSNSLKHAFPQGRKGELKLSVKKFDDNFELIISDSGIGFPEDLDYKKTHSLGLELVNTLVHQIEGTISMDSYHGTEFKIIFKESEYKERI